jgi:hypothetical protein
VLLALYVHDIQKSLRSLARSTLEHSAEPCGRDRVFDEVTMDYELQA